MAYLSIENLCKRIDKREILSNISFEVEKGTMTLIAGANGSGKSMLLKSLKGLEKIDSGNIYLNGKLLKREKERMSTFGLVFQDTELQIVARTTEKDIAFGLENLRRKPTEIKARTDEMLSLFQLEEVRDTDPRLLSGGERRRLSIADVLVMNSDCILLDEPLANLDYPSIKMVLNTLLTLKNNGVTILCVSHDAEKFLALTDNTVILNKGRVVAAGKSRSMVSELRKNNIYLPPVDYEEMKWIET